MPRDKTDTHRRFLPCIKQEFLQYGYKKASLKNIAKNAGITAAGLYRHFPSKEARFAAMVEPVTSEFLNRCNASMEETYAKLSEQDFLEHFNEFRAMKNIEFISYAYDHYDVFRLLIVCSKGTPYENFEETLIQIEQQSIRDLFSILDKDGYDTMVGEGGSTLSGGEKQQISIARAILKDAPIVILDEATSSVDSENQQQLLHAIEELTKGKTLITIAHRLNTIRNADQIVVLDAGKIAERGTHAELMRQDGIYRKFVTIREDAASWKL